MQNFFAKKKKPSGKQSVKRKNGAVASFVDGSLACFEANQRRAPPLIFLIYFGIDSVGSTCVSFQFLGKFMHFEELGKLKH